MIDPQAPPLSIFISAQTVAHTEVPSQHLTSVTALKAHNVVMAYRLSHRHGRSSDLVRLGGLSKLTERPMYRADKFGQLIRPQPMVPHISSNYFDCQMRTDRFAIHEAGSPQSLAT
jgi:hypothetical protein